LCRSGFMEIYEEHASEQNRERYITVDKTDYAYPGQLCQCLPNNGKPSAAHAVVQAMEIQGSESVPTEIAECLNAVVQLSKGDQ